MTITATQVSELREKTGVGLMECKKALVETSGDIDNAIKLLRERGLAKAAKKSDRSALEGRVFISTDSSSQQAVILELNCETDFVGSNTEFSKCGQAIASALLQQPSSTIDSIDSIQIDNQSYKDYISDYVLKLGENISVKRFEKLSGASYISEYIHMNGKIGVLVGFSKEINSDTAKDIAMHIAAVNPAYLKSEDVNSSELENEKSIIRAQSEKEGKPEAIIEKIVEGRISKYYREVCLLEQPFIKDDKQAIKDVLPGDVSILSFIRFSLS